MIADKTLADENYVLAASNEATQCPNCANTGPYLGALLSFPGGATRYAHCNNCGCSWVEFYNLTGYIHSRGT